MNNVEIKLLINVEILYEILFSIPTWSRIDYMWHPLVESAWQCDPWRRGW